ncbi:Uncharacterized protein dnm_089730 [Desulfonema magnum]|uniref:Uncharacterized protein n=1 Tax=Desulfonema magnum TaxID=45655 RepID=A0A975GT93_9BACT|nr:Uncharacterized protein dnm_089730 [Desulfonema magnum]
MLWKGLSYISNKTQKIFTDEQISLTSKNGFDRDYGVHRKSSGSGQRRVRIAIQAQVMTIRFGNSVNLRRILWGKIIKNK